MVGMLFDDGESCFRGGHLRVKIHKGRSLKAAWQGEVNHEDLHKYTGWRKGFLSCEGFTEGLKPEQVPVRDDEGNVKMGVNRAGVPVPYTERVGGRRRYNLYGRRIAVMIKDDENYPAFLIVRREAHGQELKVGDRMPLIFPAEEP